MIKSQVAALTHDSVLCFAYTLEICYWIALWEFWKCGKTWLAFAVVVGRSNLAHRGDALQNFSYKANILIE